MATVYHPTIDHSIDVPDRDVESWVEQGWRKSKPKAVTEAATENTEKKGA
jgi:hypothetical protein